MKSISSNALHLIAYVVLAAAVAVMGYYGRQAIVHDQRDQCVARSARTAADVNNLRDDIAVLSSQPTSLVVSKSISDKRAEIAISVKLIDPSAFGSLSAQDRAAAEASGYSCAKAYPNTPLF